MRKAYSFLWAMTVGCHFRTISMREIGSVPSLPLLCNSALEFIGPKGWDSSVETSGSAALWEKSSLLFFLISPRICLNSMTRLKSILRNDIFLKIISSSRFPNLFDKTKLSHLLR